MNVHRITKYSLQVSNKTTASPKNPTKPKVVFPLKIKENGLINFFVEHLSMNSFRNKNSRIDISVLIITSFHLLLTSTNLKFYVKNPSASLDQTLRIVDPVEDFLPNTINK